MFLKIAILLFTYVHYATPIRCYDCTSANNSMCLDPHLYDVETLRHFLPSQECNHGLQAVFGQEGNEFFCRKIVQTIFHKHYEPEVRVTRGCGWKRYPRECYKADNEDHLETVCQCFTDDCNTASIRHISLILLIVCLIKSLV